MHLRFWVFRVQLPQQLFFSFIYTKSVNQPRSYGIFSKIISKKYIFQSFHKKMLDQPLINKRTFKIVSSSLPLSPATPGDCKKEESVVNQRNK